MTEMWCSYESRRFPEEDFKSDNRGVLWHVRGVDQKHTSRGELARQIDIDYGIAARFRAGREV